MALCLCTSVLFSSEVSRVDQKSKDKAVKQLALFVWGPRGCGLGTQIKEETQMYAP